MAERKNIVELAQDEAQNNSSRATDSITKKVQPRKTILEFDKNKAQSEGELILGVLILCGLLFIAYKTIYAAGVALFFERYEASEQKFRETLDAQQELRTAFAKTLGAWSRFEVKNDYSVHAYIHESDFNQIPFPDRDKAIASVGKAWCSNKLISKNVMAFLPVLYIQDIQTGKNLGKYDCPIFDS